MMKTIPQEYYTPKQGRIPVFLSEFLSVTDPVMVFGRFMEGIEVSKYLTDVLKHWRGRSRYNPVDMLKTVLFAFADKGCCSLTRTGRENIRYRMDWERPSYRTFGYFIQEVLVGKLEGIFRDVNMPTGIHRCGKRRRRRPGTGYSPKSQRC